TGRGSRLRGFDAFAHGGSPELDVELGAAARAARHAGHLHRRKAPAGDRLAGDRVDARVEALADLDRAGLDVTANVNAEPGGDGAAALAHPCSGLAQEILIRAGARKALQLRELDGGGRVV